MTESELRALVRDVVARQLSAPQPGARVCLPVADASHARFALPNGDESDGPCLIEPAVRCNGCGYCQSYGH